MNEKKPIVFIGSSKLGLNIAKVIQAQLKDIAVCQVWDQGLFGLGLGSLEGLVESLDDFEFAILVLTPDDITESRGVKVQTPRDNVVFEFGLFIGHLGRDRVYGVYWNDGKTKTPTDLAGVTLSYCEPLDLDKKISTYSIKDLQLLLGPNCTEIRGAIQEALKKKPRRLSVHYIAPTSAWNDYYSRIQVRLESEIYKLKNYIWRWNFHVPHGDSVQDLYLTFEEVLRKIDPNDVIILVPRQLDSPEFLDRFEELIENKSFGKIIFIDQQPPQSLLQSSKIQFVGPDNRKIGILAAFALNKKCKDLGKCAFYVFSPGGTARVQGFVEGMKFFQPERDVTLIEMEDADRRTNLPRIKHLIKSTPAGISIGIFAGNDETAAAVLRVIEEEKRTQIFVVGCDATREMQFKVEKPNGAAIATIDTKPDNQARKIAQALAGGSPKLEEPRLYHLDPDFQKLLGDPNFKAIWEK